LERVRSLLAMFPSLSQGNLLKTLHIVKKFNMSNSASIAAHLKQAFLLKILAMTPG
jgi:hypothetical protein